MRTPKKPPSAGGRQPKGTVFSKRFGPGDEIPQKLARKGRELVLTKAGSLGGGHFLCCYAYSGRNVEGVRRV